MMTYELLRFAHLVGVLVMGGGLLAVFMADLHGRRSRDAAGFAEAAALVARCYDALVVPGALLLAAAGAVMTAVFHGAAVLDQPWLLAMIVLFTLEFIEGNTITRLAFRRLRRLSRANDPALAAARASRLAAFTHFLDLPALAVIVGLGVFRPLTWPPIIAAVAAAVAVAAVLTAAVPLLLVRPSPSGAS